MRKPSSGAPDFVARHQKRRARRTQLDRERASLLRDYLRFDKDRVVFMAPILAALALLMSWKTVLWVVGVVAVGAVGALYVARRRES